MSSLSSPSLSSGMTRPEFVPGATRNDDAVRTIDLNADLGEGFGVWGCGDDDALLGIVTSANVACGFHAGDPSVMRRVCAQAVASGVTIGAHVGYRDLVGFGRRDIAISPEDLRNESVYQIAALDGIARSEGSSVRYVKPHGALYHHVARSDEAAAALVAAIVDVRPDLGVLGPPGSALARHSQAAGLKFHDEGFADRAYTDGGVLADRSRPGALLSSPQAAADQAVDIATRRRVTSLANTPVDVPATSICVHGDTAHAVATARQVRARLLAAGVAVESFA